MQDLARMCNNHGAYFFGKDVHQSRKIEFQILSNGQNARLAGDRKLETG